MKSCGRIVWSSVLLLVLLSLHGAICDGKALYASKVIEVSSEYSQDQYVINLELRLPHAL